MINFNIYFQLSIFLMILQIIYSIIKLIILKIFLLSFFLLYENNLLIKIAKEKPNDVRESLRKYKIEKEY